MESYNPLVSVGVVTYNSAAFVLETLESIKAQTYKNIELIVSDDCSTDNTVELCRNWIEENKRYFVDAKLITVEKNTGTSGNCNRLLRECNGVWMKIIAGDDLFLNTAIEDYVKFVSNDIEIKVVFAEAIYFKGDLSSKNFSLKNLNLEKIAFNKKITAKEQFNILTRNFIGSGSTFFVKRNVVEEVGGFDERFPLQEDYPIFIKITKAGYKLHLLSTRTVYKRVYEESVQYCKDNKNAIFSNLIVRCVKDYKYQYKYENLNALWRMFLKFSLFLHNNVLDSGNSYNSKKCIFYLYIKMLFDPFDWYSRYLNFSDKHFCK